MKVTNLINILLVCIALSSCTTTNSVQFFPDNKAPEDSINWAKTENERDLLDSQDGSVRKGDGIKVIKIDY